MEPLPPPLPVDDYEPCGVCHFDHAYEYEEAVKEHLRLAEEVVRRKRPHPLKWEEHRDKKAIVGVVYYEDDPSTAFVCVVKNEETVEYADIRYPVPVRFPLKGRGQCIMPLKDFKASVRDVKGSDVLLLRG